MKIKITEIFKTHDSSIDVEVKSMKLEMSGLDVEILDGIKFNGKITNIKGTLVLTGGLIFSYNTICFRCLKQLKKSLTIRINERYSTDVDEDGLNYSIIGNYIDIDKALSDNIVLSLPMKEYCKDDCKGLCIKCGAIIDEGQCNCKEDDYINPQFEVLKEIKQT